MRVATRIQVIRPSSVFEPERDGLPFFIEKKEEKT